MLRITQYLVTVFTVGTASIWSVYMATWCLKSRWKWRANTTCKNLTYTPLNIVYILKRTFHPFCTCISDPPMHAWR